MTEKKKQERKRRKGNIYLNISQKDEKAHTQSQCTNSAVQFQAAMAGSSLKTIKRFVHNYKQISNHDNDH